jgi:hypothetical protein
MSSNIIKMTIQVIKWNPIVVVIHKSIDKVRELELKSPPEKTADWQAN